MQNSRMRCVVDTHALWWHIDSSERLSRTASDVFQKATSGEVTIVIPAIVVAELHYLSIKLGRHVTPFELIDAIRVARGFEFSDLSRAQLEKLNDLQEIPEMHDRLIAAESMILDAPLITRDSTLAGSPQIETVW